MVFLISCIFGITPEQHRVVEKDLPEKTPFKFEREMDTVPGVLILNEGIIARRMCLAGNRQAIYKLKPVMDARLMFENTCSRTMSESL
jgi:hypothetical protein